MVSSSYEYFKLERRLEMYKIKDEVELELLKEEINKINNEHQFSISISIKTYLIIVIISVIFAIWYFYMAIFEPKLLYQIMELVYFKPIVLASPGIYALYEKWKKNSKKT